MSSMPVCGWFPTALLEDIEAGVVWGARVACPTRWQLENARRYEHDLPIVYNDWCTSWGAPREDTLLATAGWYMTEGHDAH